VKLGPAYEPALVCLSNREIVYASRGRTCIATWRITDFFSNSFGLIYLAIYPPSITTGNVRPPSASTDFSNFSETGACSFDVDSLLGLYTLLLLPILYGV